MNDLPRRPDLEKIVSERLKDHQISPELVVAFSRMLGEWELHWWTEGRRFARGQIREAIGL